MSSQQHPGEGQGHGMGHQAGGHGVYGRDPPEQPPVPSNLVGQNGGGDPPTQQGHGGPSNGGHSNNGPPGGAPPGGGPPGGGLCGGGPPSGPAGRNGSGGFYNPYAGNPAFVNGFLGGCPVVLLGADLLVGLGDLEEVFLARCHCG